MQQKNILISGSKKLSKENWKVYHPNGKHMFTCGESKANWYLDRELAHIKGDFEIQFNFAPNGNGTDDNETFGKAPLNPVCVVTGTDLNLQRHHIVPYCYRTHFPEAYKSKNHHDVVLINSAYHAQYENEATKYKDEIAELYGVPTINQLNLDYSRNLKEFSNENSIILSNLVGIFKSYGNKKAYKYILNKLVIISDLTGIDLEFLKSYNYIQLYKLYQLILNYARESLYKHKGDNAKYYDHGYLVVSKLKTDEDFDHFVKLWRTHFIETMNPQFMPDGWSIGYRTKTNL